MNKSVKLLLKRVLGGLLSFALIFSSVPPDCFSQLNPGPASRANPLPGNPLPGKTLNSAWELQRWLLTFPEFSRNPAGAAHVVLRAAPQFEAKKELGKPWIAKRQGGKIFLLDEDDASRSFSVDLSLGDASQAPARLVRELQEAQELDSKYGTTGHVMRVFSLFYEDALMPDWALEKNLPSEVRVPVETRFPETPGSDIWAALESRVLEHSGLKSARSRADSLKIETASILRNDPKLSLKDAFTAAFAKVHALSPRQSEKIRTLLDHPFLTPVEDKPLLQAEEIAYTRLGVDEKYLPGSSKKSVLTHGGGVYSLGYGRVWWHKDDGNYRTELAFSPYGVGRYPVIPILPHMGRLIQAKKIGERLYLATTRGIWLLTSIFEGLPDWSGRLLKDVEAAIEQIQGKSVENPPSPGVPKPDGQGNISGEDGRTLFSGLHRASAFVTGLLGAGALEGLSRLAMSLGSLSLGFGEEAGAAYSPKREEAAGEEDKIAEGAKSRAGEIWETVKNRIEKGLGMDLKGVSAERWALETARVLETEPGLPLETALAEGLADAYPSFKKNLQAVELLLQGNPVVVPEALINSYIRQIARIGDKIYAASANLWRRELNGSWKKILSKSVSHVEEFEGNLYALADQGVYVRKKEGRENDEWLEMPAQEFSFLGVLEGSLYAAGRHGLYVLKKTKKGPRWRLKNFWDHPFDDPDHYFMQEGRLYVATRNGDLYYRHGSLKEFLRRLYYRDAADLFLDFLFFNFDFMGGGWTYVTGHLEGIRHVKTWGGKLYVAAQKGLYIFEPQNWGWHLQRLYKEIGAVSWIGELEGRLYAGAAEGFYVEENGRWESVLSGPENINQVLKTEDGIYLASSGLYRWLKKTSPSLTDGWKEKILGSIRQAADRNRPEVKEAPPPASRDLWSLLAGNVLKGLGLASENGNGEKFKEETVRMLRNNPAWPLEKALAVSLSNIHALGAGNREEAESLVAGRSYHEVGEKLGVVPYVAAIDGRLYAASEKGLYVLENNHWTPLFTESPVHFVGKIDGRLYLGADSGGYVREGDGSWDRILSEKDVVQIVKFGARLYAVAHGGLYIYELHAQSAGRDWTNDWKLHRRLQSKDSNGNVNHVARIGGKLYASTSAGLYVYEGKDWVPAVSVKIRDKDGKTGWGLDPDEVFGPIHHTAFIDGKFYLAAQKGLAVSEEGRLKPQPMGGAYYVAKIGEKIYAAAKEGLYVREEEGWRLILNKIPNRQDWDILHFTSFNGRIFLATRTGVFSLLGLQGIASGWRKTVLEDAARRIETLQRAAEEKQDASAEPFPADGQGDILGEDGRTLFDGGEA